MIEGAAVTASREYCHALTYHNAILGNENVEYFFAIGQKGSQRRNAGDKKGDRPVLIACKRYINIDRILEQVVEIYIADILIMINILQESLWRQFGASIDMLKNAIELWPEEYWYTDKKFFYNAYHCLVFLDYYLTVPPVNFASSLPFTLAGPNDDIAEDAVDDIIPNKIYSKKELLIYLQSSREKCRALIASLTEERMNEQWEEPGDRSFALPEILLYNMRHVQHHAAQLNLLLRQKINDAPDWVSRASDKME